MKVLNLGCPQSHVFEGWFGSEAEFQDQMARGLLECPVCADKAVHKLPSAPRLNLGAGRAATAGEVAPAVPAASPPVSGPLQGWPAAMARELRELVAKTENVGERFASEARRIHHGEAPQRRIRGRASAADAVELLEEGIAVLPLPDLPGLDDPLH